MITGVIETAGRMRYKDAGVMEPREKQMIEKGLADTMASLPSEMVAQISSISAPVMAGMGLMMYFYRLGTEETKLRANRAETKRSQQAAAVMEADRITKTNRNGVSMDNVTPIDQQLVQIDGAYVPTKDALLDMQGEI